MTNIADSTNSFLHSHHKFHTYTYCIWLLRDVLLFQNPWPCSGCFEYFVDKACFLSAARPVVSSAHGWPPCLHAWPQLSNQMLQGSVGCPEPCGATVRLRKRVGHQLWRQRSQKKHLSSVTFFTDSSDVEISNCYPSSSPAESAIPEIKSALSEKLKMIWAHCSSFLEASRNVLWFPFVFNY